MVKLTKRKGFNFFRSYFDVYNELETDKDKVAFIDALLDRQFLGVKPTDMKGMAKFAYISQTNSIDSQVKGYEDKTGTTLHAPIAPPTVGVIEKDLTPTLQVQVEEEVQVQVQVQEKEKVEYTKKFVFLNSLLDNGADKQLAKDWLSVRKTKKATNTETAFKGFIRQLEKTKLGINQVLKICIEKSWSGFNAEWVKDIKPIESEVNKDDLITYHWSVEGRNNKRTIHKDKAKEYFAKMSEGGYDAVVIE